MAKQDANTRALKGLVIGMGVLLVVGLTIVVVTIAMRLTGPEGADGPPAEAGGDTTPRPAARAAGAQPFGALQLGVADSCRIADAVASGDTLVVRVEGPAKDDCGQLVVVDPGVGRVLGRIRPGAAGTPARAEAAE